VKKVTRTILFVALGLVVLFLLIQLVPFGRNHTNPPVVSEPKWDSPATRALAQRACFDCHSNETVWPWYSNVAPVSWLVASDVQDGRRRMNFSEWNRGFQPSIGEISGIIQEGEMPPAQYLLMHPQARLTDTEKQSLINGLRNSLP
jgi:Haem-binding domain